MTTDPLTKPFRAELPAPMTPDFAQMLVDARTTPDGALELRQRAVAAARGVIAEARDGREHEVRLTTLAQLVAVGRLDEARAMAADLIDNRPTTLEGAEFKIKGGRATITTYAWPFLALAQHLAGIFETTDGAVNYIEQRMEQADPTRPGYLLTMQRMERPTPHGLRRAAEARADAAEARLKVALAEAETLRGQIAQSSERCVPWLRIPPGEATVKAHSEAHPWHEVTAAGVTLRVGLWQVRWREANAENFGGTVLCVCHSPVAGVLVSDMSEDIVPVADFLRGVGAETCEWRPLTADHEPVCEHLRAVERQAAPTITISPAHAPPDGVAAAVRDALGAAKSPTDEIAQLSDHAAAPPAAPAPALTAEEIARLPRRRSVAVIVPYPTRGYLTPGDPEERFAAVRVASRGGSIEPAGGKVEDGESAYDAATREAFEELGVQVEVSMRGLGVYEHVHNGCVWHCHFYVGSVLDTALRGGREGTASWVTREELTSGAFGSIVARALRWLDDRNALPSCI